MAQKKTVFDFAKFSMKSRTWKNLHNSPRLVSVRYYSDEKKEIRKTEPYELPKLRDVMSLPPGIHYWNETAAIKRIKKQNKIWRRVDSMVDFANALQLTQKFPGNSLKDLLFNIKQKITKNIILEQKFLIERHEHLKHDLASAHFLIRRGGSVMFVGRNEWVSFDNNFKRLPFFYIPGFFVEKINAEGTDLYFEGLMNLISLKYLKWLSLKGNKEINDWCLDWISREYYKTLEHLDISDCKAITHRGLSCFYRFERLKTLEVKGVPDTPEFKLACLKLQDIIPELEITGIDLSVPKKIDPVDIEKIQNISAS